MREELRRETAALHTELDRHPLLAPLTSDDLTTATYCEVLGRFYGLYDPLEKLLAKQEFIAFDFPWRDSRKSRRLADDLATLGVEASSLPRCQELPVLADRFAAAGCIYVLEGAGLGGQLIKRSVSRRLPTGCGSTFFEGYGNETISNWQRTVDRLDQLGEQAADEQRAAMLVAARATFSTFLSWLTVKH